MNRDELIDHAYAIAEEYVDQGLTLTLRQLYYQFVARGLTGNGQRVYKRIGAALTKARLDGRFPIEWIEDRGRTMTDTIAWASLDVPWALREAEAEISRMPSRFIHAGRWYEQPRHVSVFVEKQALAGVLEPTCEELEVSLFPCKGYPSISAVKTWVDGVYEHIGDEAVAVIVYLGDHDPDGLQIPKSLEEQIVAVQEVTGRDFAFEVDVVALTREQIAEHNPPPFPAKETSSRFDAYVRRTGLTQAWELDALDPTTLRRVVVDAVDAHHDASVFARCQAEATARRREFAREMQGLAR